MAGMSPTRRRSRKPKLEAPAVSVADYYRWRLTRPGAADSDSPRPTIEDYLSYAASAGVCYAASEISSTHSRYNHPTQPLKVA